MGNRQTSLNERISSTSNSSPNLNSLSSRNKECYTTRKEFEKFIRKIAICNVGDQWKLNQNDENLQFYTSNREMVRKLNCSWLESEFPSEIIFEILLYLLPEDLIILSEASWNFRYIWTEHPLLWYNLKNDERSFISKKDVEQFINNPSVYVSNWKSMYAEIKSVMRYPVEFETFADSCVNFGRIYGEYNQIKKIGFIGPKGSGKTSYCKLLFNNVLDMETKPTIGSDYYAQYLNLTFQENGKTIKDCIKLEIWDISFIFPTMYRGLHKIYFCFDLSNEESLYTMLELFKDYCLQSGCDINNFQNDQYDKEIVFLGLKKDSKKISNYTINNCLSKFINRSLPYNQRNVAYFEVSSKERDKTTFYPIIHLAREPSKFSSDYRYPLTRLTKENEERFRDYGALD